MKEESHSLPRRGLSQNRRLPFQTTPSEIALPSPVILRLYAKGKEAKKKRSHLLLENTTFTSDEELRVQAETLR